MGERIVLLVTCVLMYVFLKIYVKKNNMDNFLISILALVTFCYASNEILSCFELLDRLHLIVVHGTIDLVLLSLIIIKLAKKKRIKFDLMLFFTEMKKNKIAIAFATFFVGMFALASVTIPYNMDSMMYHLPRIMQWAQNKTVAHYITYDVRQLTSPVLAEFINLQLYLLVGRGDSLFNLLQYFSYMVNAILVYYITKKIGVSRKYCWLSMLLFISMPIAFGEALSTQVDHFSTLFLLIFTYFVLDLLSIDFKLSWNKSSRFYVWILSVCIGLGYLAKPSIMFGMIFLAIWLLIVTIQRKDSIKDIICLIVLAGVIVFAIIAPEALRNIRSFQAISDPIAGARQLVGTWNPFYLLVNGLKNYTMNLPNVYVDWGGLVQHGVYWIAYILGVDIHDYSIAEDGREFYLHQPGTYGHDVAINPVVVILATIAMLWLLLRKFKREKYDMADDFSVFAIGAFLFFCIILRWEPFVTRYMLSYLALLCPVVAVLVGKVKKNNQAILIGGIVTFVCVVEIIDLYDFHSEIVYRQKEESYSYFEYMPHWRNDYELLSESITALEPKSIGLYISMGIYEYPIWNMIEDNVRVENILVENNTTKYADENFIPEVIIVMNKDENNILNYKGKKYSCYQRTDANFSVWQLEKE